MKRILVAVLALVLVASVASAATTMKMVVNGKATESKVAPQFINNTLMVPAEALIDTLGMDMTWDVKTNTLTVTGGDPKALAEQLALAQARIKELEAVGVGRTEPATILTGAKTAPFTIKSDGGITELTVTSVQVSSGGVVIRLKVKNNGVSDLDFAASLSEIVAGTMQAENTDYDCDSFCNDLRPGVVKEGYLKFPPIPSGTKELKLYLTFWQGSIRNSWKPEVIVRLP